MVTVDIEHQEEQLFRQLSEFALNLRMIGYNDNETLGRMSSVVYAAYQDSKIKMMLKV